MPAPSGQQSGTTNWRKDSRLERFAWEVGGATGLNLIVIQCWVIAEGGPIDNPLNIGPGRHYGSLDSAALATIRVLHQSNMSMILDAKGKGPDAQIEAIKASPWDAGHYGNGSLDAIYAEFRGKAHGKDHLPGFGRPPLNDGEVTGPIKSAVTAVPDFLGKIADPTLWVRVLYVMGGAIFLLAGLAILVRQLAGGSGPSVSVNPITNAKTLGLSKLGKVGSKLETKPTPKPKPQLEGGK